MKLFLSQSRLGWAKRHFAEALLANTNCTANFNAYVTRIKEGKDNDHQKPAMKKADNDNVTVLPTIAFLNDRIGAPTPTPDQVGRNPTIL